MAMTLEGISQGLADYLSGAMTRAQAEQGAAAAGLPSSFVGELDALKNLGLSQADIQAGLGELAAGRLSPADAAKNLSGMGLTAGQAREITQGFAQLIGPTDTRVYQNPFAGLTSPQAMAQAYPSIVPYANPEGFVQIMANIQAITAAYPPPPGYSQSQIQSCLDNGWLSSTGNIEVPGVTYVWDPVTNVGCYIGQQPGHALGSESYRYDPTTGERVSLGPYNLTGYNWPGGLPSELSMHV